jgi:7-cyano-7-deazaguanine synthase
MSSIVVLSGGLDSTVSLAYEKSNTKLILFFNYHQLALEKERSAVKKISKYYKIPWKEVEINFMDSFKNVPENVKIDSKKETEQSAEVVWVPNRNALFANIAAYFAALEGAKTVVMGFNKEEAETFPDNSSEFVKRVNDLWQYSLKKKIVLKSHTIEMMKSQIVKAGQELDVPWKYIWSCYLAHEKMCGKCESCLRLKRAISSTDVKNYFTERFLE